MGEILASLPGSKKEEAKSRVSKCLPVKYIYMGRKNVVGKTNGTRFLTMCVKNRTSNDFSNCFHSPKNKKPAPMKILSSSVVQYAKLIIPVLARLSSAADTTAN